MARKIKFHSLHILFRLFAFLADKTGGWHLFVKPKMIIGSLLLGLGLTGCNSKSETKTEIKKANEIQVSVTNQETDNRISSKKDKVPYLEELKQHRKTSNHRRKKNLNNHLCTIDRPRIYEKVDQMPEFPGGKDSLQSYIEKNIIYPTLALQNWAQGDVKCRFVVTSKGEVEQAEITKPIVKELNKEALRIINSLPKFIPGKKNGIYVNAWCSITISFKLPKDLKKMVGTMCYVATKPKNYAIIDTSETKKGKETIYLMAETPARFRGSSSNLSSLIGKLQKYPINAKEKNIQGTVLCRFLISKTGKIKKVSVIESLDKECDTEALRIIKKLPKFIPGKVEGKNVAVWYSLPIEFKLPEN